MIAGLADYDTAALKTNRRFWLANAAMRGYTPAAGCLACYPTYPKLPPMYTVYDDIARDESPINAPIHLAVRANDLKAVRLLLERGDSPDARVLDTGEPTALHLAISLNLPDILRLLLQYGASTEARNYAYSPNSTPLTMAMSLGQVELMRLLLAHGADPNAPNDEGDHPLAVAIKLNAQPVLDTLLDAAPSLDLNAPDENGAPGLLRFIMSHKPEAVAFLLDLGADPNAVAPGSGNTPLHAAALCHQASLVELLLQYGANPCLANKRGELPQDVTTHPLCLSLLRAAAARCPHA